MGFFAEIGLESSPEGRGYIYISPAKSPPDRPKIAAFGVTIVIFFGGFGKIIARLYILHTKMLRNYYGFNNLVRIVCRICRKMMYIYIFSCIFIT